MTKQQTQKVRRQMRTTLKNDFRTFLKTLTPDDIENIFKLAMANRQAEAKQEVRP